MDNPTPIGPPGGAAGCQHPDILNRQSLEGIKVAILYSDAKREYFATDEHYLTEIEVIERARLIAPYFEKMGASVELLAGNDSLGKKLREIKPSLALNLVDSIRGQEYLAAGVPGILELLNLPYTGSGILGVSLNHNKFLTKKILEQYGLPVPRYQLMDSANNPANPLLRYPLISKINDIHGSVEIDETAISENERHLRERVKKLVDIYKQEVIVEEFIAGRELTAIVFEGMKKKVYVGEKMFSAERPYQIASFQAVWGENKTGAGQSYAYSKFEPNEQLKKDIKKAYEVLKMEDYAKFDIRLDSSGRYYFIDPNVNPAFGPKEADCAMGTIMGIYGVDFPEILRRLVANTLAGQNNGGTAGKPAISWPNGAEERKSPLPPLR